MSPTAVLACALERSNPGCESVQRATLAAGFNHYKVLTALPHHPQLQVSFIFWGGASDHDR